MRLKNIFLLLIFLVVGLFLIGIISGVPDYCDNIEFQCSCVDIDDTCHEDIDCCSDEIECNNRWNMDKGPTHWYSDIEGGDLSCHSMGMDIEITLCEDESQLIMKLAKKVNSHGAVWNYDEGDNENYLEGVCYNEIFDLEFPSEGLFEVSESSHECINEDENSLIWLFGANSYIDEIYNSHASTFYWEDDSSSDIGYIHPICFGNLNCESKDSCESDEKIVLELYNNFNSHISKFETPDQDTICGSANCIDEAYIHKICCKAGYPVNMYWANLKGDPITTANRGDKVRLVVKGGFEGTKIDYVIDEDGPLGYGDNTNRDNLNSQFIGNDWVWTVKDDIWSQGEIVDGDEKFLYFTAQFDNQDGKSSSEDCSNILLTCEPFNDYSPQKDVSGYNGLLKVSPSQINKRPVAQISYPGDGDVFILGEGEIQFTQSSYDYDDFFDYIWDIDGEEYFGSNDPTSVDYIPENYNPNHTFSTEGTKTITLTITDERGKTSTASININIYGIGDSYVVAVINNPSPGEEISSDLVEFDASESYAASITGRNDITGEIEVECLAGSCPDGSSGAGEIIFNWNIEGTSSTDPTPTEIFTELGEHEVNLMTTYTSPEGQTKTDDYTLNFFTTTYGYCGDFGEIWYDSEGTQYDTYVSGCEGSDGIGGPNENGISDDCCPQGYVCTGDGCQPDLNLQTIASGLVSCSDYDSPENCTADPFGMGRIGQGTEFCGVSSESSCGEVFQPNSNCTCDWSGGECKLKIGGIIEIGEVNVDYICRINVETGECINGIMEAQKTSEIEVDEQYRSQVESCSNELCPSSGSSEIICGQAMVKLPFFGMPHIFITILGIALIYFIRIKRER